MNMDYCKYENTLAALRQCAEDWTNDDIHSLNEHEAESKEELIRLMKKLLTWEGFTIEGSIDPDDYNS